MNAILEVELIEGLTRAFDRSPFQLNRLQETDAEIVLLPSRSGRLLALTTDSIAEELSSGLYDDMYLAGWMIVMVNMSDLAAVGAAPLGLLVSEIFPLAFDETSMRRLQRGIRDACKACGTHLLGGDTNFGSQLTLTGTAIDMEDTLAFSVLENIRPMIETAPLEQAADAYARMVEGKARFRMVLVTQDGGAQSSQNAG